MFHDILSLIQLHCICNFLFS